MGGFPCEAFSWLSRSTRLLGDVRARGFWKVCDTVRASRPALVILENVVGFLRVKNIALRHLEQCGPYRIAVNIIDPVKLGYPCMRQRVCINMVRDDLLQKKYATPDKFSEQLHKVLERMTLNPKCGGCGFLELLYPPGHAALQDPLHQEVPCSLPPSMGGGRGWFVHSPWLHDARSMSSVRTASARCATTVLSPSCTSSRRRSRCASGVG